MTNMLRRCRVPVPFAGLLILLHLGAAASLAQTEKPQDPFVGRYASDDFFAGCYLRPAKLNDVPFANWIYLTPEAAPPVSLQRLKAAHVSELALFASPSAGKQIEWAMAARFSQPIDLKELLAQWRHSRIPGRYAPNSEPDVVQIEGRQCYRLRAGSFLNSPRVYGDLQFTDRDGQPSDGINVGSLNESRKYVEGGTLSTAEFSLGQVTESVLIDNRLPLEIRLNVFRTYRFPAEFSRARIIFRNPKNGVESKPLDFAAKSYENREFLIPRALTVVAGGVERQGDLFEDLISDGKLEVVIKGDHQAIYYGVGQRDLNISAVAHEYVYLAGHELVVAQTPETMAKMLLASQAPGKLAERLSSHASDATVIVDVRNLEQRRGLQRLASLFGDHQTLHLMGDAIVSVTAKVNGGDSVGAHIAFEMTDDDSALKLRVQVNRALRRLKRMANKEVVEFSKGHDALGGLLGIVFLGVPMGLPRINEPPVETEIALRAMVSEASSGVAVKAKDTKAKATGLEITVTPPEFFARMPARGRFALSWYEEKRAKSLFVFEHFELGDEMYERVTSRSPRSSAVWFRRAHHLAYNMSIEFDGHEARYAWVHHGIGTLLDGVEDGANNVDLLWMAAKLIGDKVGASDDRAEYRVLFARDQALHRQLGKFVDIDKARRANNGSVDEWLVAQLLYQHCVDQYANSDRPASIPLAPLYAGPAMTQAQHASALDAAGEAKAATIAWAKAQRMYEQLADRPIEVNGAKLKLSQLEDRLTRFGEDDVGVKWIQNAKAITLFDYWVTRCELEQEAAIRSARQLGHEASLAETREDLTDSFGLYRRALTALDRQRELRPDQMDQIAHDFRAIAKGCRRVTQQLEEEVDDIQELTLEWIENSEVPYPFPLVNP